MGEGYQDGDAVGRLLGLTRKLPEETVTVKAYPATPNTGRIKSEIVEIKSGGAAEVAVRDGQLLRVRAEYPHFDLTGFSKNPGLIMDATAANLGMIGLYALAGDVLVSGFAKKERMLHSAIKKITGIDVSKSKLFKILSDLTIGLGLVHLHNKATIHWEEKTKTKVPNVGDLLDLAKEATGVDGLGDLGL